MITIADINLMNFIFRNFVYFSETTQNLARAIKIKLFEEKREKERELYREFF